MRIFFVVIFIAAVIFVLSLISGGGASSCGDDFYCAPGLPVTDSTGITIEAPPGW